jgi:predicted permease
VRFRSGRILAVTQVSLSLVLLVGAGLFIRSVQTLHGQDAGFRRESVLVVRVEPEGSDQRGTPGTSERLDRIYRGLLQRVNAIPGVQSAGLAQFTPRNTRGLSAPIELPSGEEVRAFVPMVYPGYFSAVGVPMMAGRDFSAGDLNVASPPVVVVNQTFARLMFRNERAVGQQFRTGGKLREVIGVAQDSPYTNLRGETPPTVYQPFLQTNTGRGQMALYVRVAGDSGAIAQHIRKALESIDNRMPMFEVLTLAEEINAALIPERLIATLSSFFGGLALLLACVGLYGLLALAVVQRTGEMGIRMALGARRGDVVWVMMREALVLVLIGVAVGVPVALAAGQLASSHISGLLFRVRTTDPLAIAGAAVLLILVATAASYVPARRASLIDPMVALRNE